VGLQVYIRQLAIQLRSAMTATGTKRKEADQAVSCWQFVNSLCLWARVLSSYPGEDQLYALVYPYVQVRISCQIACKHVRPAKATAWRQLCYKPSFEIDANDELQISMLIPTIVLKSNVFPFCGYRGTMRCHR
jgi:hypothetical protein